MTTIEHLRKLYEAATPGPWAAEPGDVLDIDSERWSVMTAGLVRYFVATIENGRPGDTVATEKANADLIVAMHEAMPLLLNLADAAIEYVQHQEAASLVGVGPLTKEAYTARRMELHANLHRAVGRYLSTQATSGPYDALAAVMKERDAFRAALAMFVDYAGRTWDYWDADADHKVGKRLAAMAGTLPKYDAMIDSIHKMLDTPTTSGG